MTQGRPNYHQTRGRPLNSRSSMRRLFHPQKRVWLHFDGVGHTTDVTWAWSGLTDQAVKLRDTLAEPENWVLKHMEDY